jgi:hypothetical protein
MSNHSVSSILLVLRKRLFFHSLPYQASFFSSTASLLSKDTSLYFSNPQCIFIPQSEPHKMATSQLNLLMPFNSIPATAIHPSSIPKSSTPTPLFISPISPKSTSPYYTKLYPHSYNYTPSPSPSPEPQCQSPPQTPAQIHPSHSLKRSHSSISSPINSSYSNPKRIRTDEKEQNQLPTPLSSERSKYLESDNSTYEEDIPGQEDEQTINDEEMAVLRKDIDEYCSLMLCMAEIIEGALEKVGWEAEVDETGQCGRILS